MLLAKMCVFGWFVGRSVGDENSVCGKQGGKRLKIRKLGNEFASKETNY